MSRKLDRLVVSSGDPGLHAYEVGAGRVIANANAMRLEVAASRGDAYADAQVDDYHADGTMRWRPGTSMRLRARFSHPAAALAGTAGFGFWNDPFGMTRMDARSSWLTRLPLPRWRLPQAIWFFFASPPSEMALTHDVPGHGWKAATLDASSLRAKALMPLAPAGMLACRVPALYGWVWPLAQRTLKIAEATLPLEMEKWHDYRLEWLCDGACFRIDGKEVLSTAFSPRGPLGFVAWIDNQYMVATPQGEFASGVVACGDQWLEINALEVSAG